MRSQSRALAFVGVGERSGCVLPLAPEPAPTFPAFPSPSQPSRLCLPGVLLLFTLLPLCMEWSPPPAPPTLASSPRTHSFPSLPCHSFHETSPHLEVIYFSSWPSQHLSHQLQCCGRTFGPRVLALSSRIRPSVHRTATEGIVHGCVMAATWGTFVCHALALITFRPVQSP